mmetsp:Transcript_6344/g.14045  ORF Transcript_6344/g.14045 Transcript_6344/m.14045 type:complete len:242 (-) Transcript_6344:715-1440(-)
MRLQLGQEAGHGGARAVSLVDQQHAVAGQRVVGPRADDGVVGVGVLVVQVQLVGQGGHVLPTPEPQVVPEQACRRQGIIRHRQQQRGLELVVQLLLVHRLLNQLLDVVGAHEAGVTRQGGGGVGADDGAALTGLALDGQLGVVTMRGGLLRGSLFLLHIEGVGDGHVVALLSGKVSAIHHLSGEICCLGSALVVQDKHSNLYICPRCPGGRSCCLLGINVLLKIRDEVCEGAPRVISLVND